ncbi:MAG: sugar phosphate isomerase/epimerase, partial [Armatimonadetes bacterium]|nr:sugar phosphate isomerase/epimerase [Armatimonadota bacterium]
AHLQRMAAVMSQALATAPPGLKLAVDLHIGAVVETVADAERLFALTDDPRAGLTLNIGHLTTGEQPGWELIERHPERLHVIAWKDHLRQPPADWPHRVWSVEVGTGDSPFGRYLEALQRTPVVAEHLITFENVPLAEKAAALRRSREYLEGLWHEVTASGAR